MLNQMEDEVKFLERELLKIKERSEQGNRLFACQTMYDMDSFNTRNDRNDIESVQRGHDGGTRSTRFRDRLDAPTADHPR
mmetsp:Transcript_2961/g.3336  ORF Transcript_2961/g.3336 Transcript_2961/m.3336 type:complete len:80 (-) Transcript_2961:427-666(-)